MAIHKTTLEIVVLTPSLKRSLADLFAEIRETGEASFFHPHPFTPAEAERLCNHIGKDQYYALVQGEKVLGYSMLRGWDAGYTIPSLGIFLRKTLRGQGLGKLMMSHLHAVAKQQGVRHVRLKVHQDNLNARRLYEKLGYVFESEEDGQSVGIVTLS